MSICIFTNIRSLCQDNLWRDYVAFFSTGCLLCVIFSDIDEIDLFRYLKIFGLDFKLVFVGVIFCIDSSSKSVGRCNYALSDCFAPVSLFVPTPALFFKARCPLP